MILGLTILTFLASGPMWKALLMAAFGLFLGCIGMDTMTGTPRFTLDIIELSDGVGLVPVVMGLFGISEVLLNVEQIHGAVHLRNEDQTPPPQSERLGGFDLAHSPRDGHRFFSGGPSRRRGGHFLLRLLRRGEEDFQIPGEIRHRNDCRAWPGPEAANNAATGGAFIPLLTLGIPANAVMAILLGAMMIHGMQPGPMLVKEHPGLFWGAVTSMYLGNAMLLVLNLPLIGLWVKILRVPYPILFPLILLFCLIGSYSLNNSIVEVVIMVIFGLHRLPV